jgi:hypothetical protein
MKATVRIHTTRRSAIDDADARPMKQIWKSLTRDVFAVGDQEDLPTTQIWVEIGRRELGEVITTKH